MIVPQQAQQLVLRAVCFAAAEVRWTLERADADSRQALDGAADLDDLLEEDSPDAGPFASGSGSGRA
jgi:hypothetical protein